MSLSWCQEKQSVKDKEKQSNKNKRIDFFAQKGFDFERLSTAYPSQLSIVYIPRVIFREGLHCVKCFEATLNVQLWKEDSSLNKTFWSIRKLSFIIFCHRCRHMTRTYSCPSRKSIQLTFALSSFPRDRSANSGAYFIALFESIFGMLLMKIKAPKKHLSDDTEKFHFWQTNRQRKLEPSGSRMFARHKHQLIIRKLSKHDRRIETKRFFRHWNSMEILMALNVIIQILRCEMLLQTALHHRAGNDIKFSFTSSIVNSPAPLSKKDVRRWGIRNFISK